MPRWPPGLHPFAQSGRGGPGSQAVRRVTPANIFAYQRKVTGVPLQPGQAQTTIPVTLAPRIVNHTQGVLANVSSGTITIPATTAGNTLIVASSSWDTTGGTSVSAMTLGGSPGNFTQRVHNFSNVPNEQQWEDWNIPGGQTSFGVTFTLTGSYAAFDIYEVSGLLNTGAFDQSSTGFASSASWSSGATPVTSQANELVVGLVGTSQNTTITGPVSPWVNEPQQTFWTGPFTHLSGYQVASAAAAFTYLGTFLASSGYAALIGTYKSANQVVGSNQLSLGPVGVGNIWYPAQVTISTTSGVADTSTFNLYLGPAGIPITLVGTLFPGGAGTIALAIPPMSPGQYLIGVWTGAKPGDVASMNVIGDMDAVTT